MPVLSATKGKITSVYFVSVLLASFTNVMATRSPVFIIIMHHDAFFSCLPFPTPSPLSVLRSWETCERTCALFTTASKSSVTSATKSSIAPPRCGATSKPFTRPEFLFPTTHRSRYRQNPPPMWKKHCRMNNSSCNKNNSSSNGQLLTLGRFCKKPSICPDYRFLG